MTVNDSKPRPVPHSKPREQLHPVLAAGLTRGALGATLLFVEPQHVNKVRRRRHSVCQQ